MMILDQFLERARLRHEAKLVRDTAGATRDGGRFDHARGRLDVERERLFAQDVLAGFQRRQHVVQVCERRRRDRNGVKLASGEHFGARAKRVRNRSLGSVACGARRRRERDDLETRMRAQRRQVRRDAEPGPDDADADGIHVLVLLDGVDDGAFAILDYGDGLVARLTADATTSAQSYTCAVHGEDRTAVASGENIVELTLYAVDADETSELECKPSPYARYGAINANVPLLMELYDEFVNAIEGRPNALPAFAEALETQRVLEAVGYATPTLPAHA